MKINWYKIYENLLRSLPVTNLVWIITFLVFDSSDKKDSLDGGLTTDGTVFSSPPPLKRPKVLPAIEERVMLYVRQENEDVYTPLHVAPPTTQGLLNAVSLSL